MRHRIGPMRHCRVAAFACVLSMTAGLASSAAANELDDVRVTTQPLRDGLHMLVGRGGNVAVSTGHDGVMVIDDQFAPLAPKILAAIARLDAGPVRWVVNTHWHGDHTGGNASMHQAGAVIVAHDRVRERMSSEQLIEALGRRVPASPPAALPTITFRDRVTFHFNAQTVRAEHLNRAHTDGDAVIHFMPADVMHTGDAFVSGMYPFVDASSGGRFLGILEGAERMLELAGEETLIVPGHGPLSRRADLVAYRDMLATVRDRIAPLVAAGKTRDAIVASRPTADLDAAWGGGFMPPDRFVGLVAESLAAERGR